MGQNGMGEGSGHSERLMLRRRTLIAGAGVGAAVTAGLVIRNQFRHPPAYYKAQLDGRFRRLVLSWPTSNTLVFAVARARFFERYNLDVVPVEGARTGRGTIADLRGGHCVGAVAPLLTWLDVFREGGLQARIVAGMQSGAFRLLLRRGVKVTRLDNVAGLRIAFTDRDMADRLFFSVMMRRKGIDPESGVQWVVISPDHVLDAARGGEIDAVVAHDPLAWQLLHGPNPLFSELANSTTGHYGERTNLALGLSDAFLQSDPAAAVALVMALRAASGWIQAQPDQVATLLAGQIAGMGADELRAMLRHETLGVSPVGADLRVQVAQYVDEMKLLGRMPDTVGSSAYARKICFNVLQAEAPGQYWSLPVGPT
ncbi:nitrate/sulfonate/bicarbonate ABC transporter substrate-binding periplasmic protein [Gluconacetobacter azotocaptans DSM 13594]|nr:nitrate/sulfonate/bicarbonate ABC transporter substrate-binding periplasmic protein [Gluconacetobacter azotocaptans DSM 13594]